MAAHNKGKKPYCVYRIYEDGSTKLASSSYNFETAQNTAALILIFASQTSEEADKIARSLFIDPSETQGLGKIVAIEIRQAGQSCGQFRVPVKPDGYDGERFRAQFKLYPEWLQKHLKARAFRRLTAAFRQPTAE